MAGRRVVKTSSAAMRLAVPRDSLAAMATKLSAKRYLSETAAEASFSSSPILRTTSCSIRLLTLCSPIKPCYPPIRASADPMARSSVAPCSCH